MDSLLVEFIPREDADVAGKIATAKDRTSIGYHAGKLLRLAADQNLDLVQTARMLAMAMDNVGIVVDDLPAAIAFALSSGHVFSSTVGTSAGQ